MVRSFAALLRAASTKSPSSQGSSSHRALNGFLEVKPDRRGHRPPAAARARKNGCRRRSESSGGDRLQHENGAGEAFRRAAYQHGLEGVVSKRLDRPYLPGDRGAWVKTKCLNRAEFVVVGWSDPEGSRPYIGALLLGYFEPDGRLVYAGRVGTGMSQKTLATLHKRLRPLAIRKMPLAAPPPRDNRFGRPLELAKVHWLRPELAAEITYRELAGRWPSSSYSFRRLARGQTRVRGPAGETTGAMGWPSLWGRPSTPAEQARGCAPLSI